MPDLYHENGIYWFYHGWNWRVALAWLLAMIPSFRKDAFFPLPHLETKWLANIYVEQLALPTP